MPLYKCPFCHFENKIKTKVKIHLERKKKCYKEEDLNKYILASINKDKLINKMELNYKNKIKQCIPHLC